MTVVLLILQVFSLFLIHVLGADVWFSQPSYTCLVSQNALVGETVSKIKALTAIEGQRLNYSIIDGGDFVHLIHGNDGHIKLSQAFGNFTGDTRRVNITIKAFFQDNPTKSAQVTIHLIVLKLNFGDKYVSTVLSSIDNFVKNDNIFRPVSAKYPVYKRLHRILMQPSLRSRSVSKAGVTFLRVLKEITKLIIREFLGSTGRIRHQLSVGGTLSVERLEEITTLTNCHEAVKQPSSCPVNNKYRTIDGTCNNLKNPNFGAAETGFFRLLDPEYFDADGTNDPLGAGDQPGAPERPNPFQVTQDLIREQTRGSGNDEQTSLMHMQWGQFIDHDMTLTPESEGGDTCENIPCTDVDEDFVDPCYPILPIAARNQCIKFIRSAAVCQDDAYDLKPREQINVNTAFLDASMIYGSSKQIQTTLRNLTNELGLLRVSGPRGNLLPLDNSELVAPISLCLDFGGCFLAGDLRANEQASLTSIHTLFVREHNRIAKELKVLNPHWEGETIYQETRKIVGALVQKITYEDWLPITLGQRPLGRYKGYKKNVNPGISNSFAAAAFRFGHSTIQPKFDYLNANFDPIFKPIPLVQMFFNNTLLQRDGIEGFMFGATGNFSQSVDVEVAKGLTRRLFQRATNVGLDLAALNIQRGRDHGIPSYEAFRKECGFKPAQSFDDLKTVIRNDTLRNILKQLYNTPDNTDLWAAGLAEDVSTSGSLGPTFACLVRDQFRRLRDGDRFYYKNTGVFTTRQVRSLREASLSRIMCDNLEGIVSIQENAFKVPCNGNSQRRSCSRIPSLNLKPWKEFRSPCAENPCRNGGTCMPKNRRGFKCNCTIHHFGRYCQRNRNPCKPNPCMNGGKCRRCRLTEKYQCECRKTGFKGDLCQHKI